MMNTLSTPGVYINEVNAFPNSVVAVATAVPAFVGYTVRADYKGKSLWNSPVKIRSLNDFRTFFGALDDQGPAPELEQYRPVYIPVPVAKGRGEMTIGGKAFDLLPDPGTIYYLYNSIRLFYENGGADCYVVAVGPLGKPTGMPLAAGAPLVNPNVKLAELKAGLDSLELEAEPTMLVIPDGLLLSRDDYSGLMQAMLTQCGELGSRIAILDVYGGENPDAVEYSQDIDAFRTAVGMDNLKFGAAYYPFLKTTITQDGEIDFVNLGGGDLLATILPLAGNGALKTLLEQIRTIGEPNGPAAAQVEDGLRQASAEYQQLHEHVLAKINTLPPAAAMAGVYTSVDHNYGVWKAPANVSLNAVAETTLPIDDETQGPLNIDAATGKSINALRLFPGFGVMVWGARTLDGNSQDWRYINVRRTVIMIEQSVKLAARAYVFSPNVAGTWSLMQSMLASFLTNLWTQGALAGAAPAAAFDVAVGLGVTMTAEDILNGIMNITVRVAVSHPAEFIVITVSQKMQTS